MLPDSGLNRFQESNIKRILTFSIDHHWCMCPIGLFLKVIYVVRNMMTCIDDNRPNGLHI
jgi:hypothetical protein